MANAPAIECTAKQQPVGRVGNPPILAGLIECAPKLQAHDIVKPDGQDTSYELPKTITLILAINHATEHRAQIMTTLTQLGIQPPDLDGWTYFREQGK